MPVLESVKFNVKSPPCAKIGSPNRRCKFHANPSQSGISNASPRTTGASAVQQATTERSACLHAPHDACPWGDGADAPAPPTPPGPASARHSGPVATGGSRGASSVSRRVTPWRRRVVRARCMVPVGVVVLRQLHPATGGRGIAPPQNSGCATPVPARPDNPPIPSPPQQPMTVFRRKCRLPVGERHGTLGVGFYNIR